MIIEYKNKKGQPRRTANMNNEDGEKYLNYLKEEREFDIVKVEK